MSEASQKLVNIYKYKLEVKNCPYCNSSDFKKHGRYKYTNRYKCKKCNKTFLPSSGTSLHYIHKKDVFLDYAEALKKDGMQSVKKMSERFNISKLTSFDWRHKILASIPQNANYFKDEVFCQDLNFIFSQKGRRGLKASRKRGGYLKLSDPNKLVRVMTISDYIKTDMKLASIGSLKKEHLFKILNNKIKYATKIIAPQHLSFINFYEFAGINYEFIQLKDKKVVKNKSFQQSIDFQQNFKIWINHCLKGVSTKYLQLYANYFITRENKCFNALSKNYLNQKFIWRIFTQMEEIFKKFLNNCFRQDYYCKIKRSWKNSSLFFLKYEHIPY